MRDREPQEPAAPGGLGEDAPVQGDSRDSSQSLGSSFSSCSSGS